MSDPEIVVSAPGKVILFGEHAVVYGRKAIAASLDLRTQLKIHLIPDSTAVTLELPDISLSNTWQVADLAAAQPTGNVDVKNPSPPSDKYLAALHRLAGTDTDHTDTRTLALLAFLYMYTSIHHTTVRKCPAGRFHAASQLPPGAGLGSSAAYCTALAAGLLTMCNVISRPEGKTWSKEDLEVINAWAFQGEKLIHGNPSGIDNSVSTFGDAISFKSGKISPFESVAALKILLVNTKGPRSTKVLVQGVRDRYNRLPAIMEPILDSIEEISCTCERVLLELGGSPVDGQENTQGKNYQILEELVDICQCLLNALGVGHPSLDQVSSITAKHGLHSKLTGAGGGGCALVLLRPDTAPDVIDKVTAELRDCGYDVWETSIGATGVSQHSQPK
ncbi:PREDICTED: mevalonate kinase-like [Branchiostoma belcheri]|uniref:Mevalonate kinase n=1 Tax=Branchiostoma belcheri TaxID=7741 RepID=A0A6P4YHS3_BRABE|nr:PREDICTED: mevalonate kinase-like [Branchiostoma belcheri]